MKFFVSKKCVISLTYITLLYNIILLIIFIIAALKLQHQQTVATTLMTIVLVSFIVFNIIMLSVYSFWGSTVLLETKTISCGFIKRKRLLLITSIKDYDTFWYGKTKFIYISDHKLSEAEKENIWKIYRKNRNIIILQCNEKAMNFLETAAFEKGIL